jgi:membrane-associated phospholipid phosphatase
MRLIIGCIVLSTSLSAQTFKDAANSSLSGAYKRPAQSFYRETPTGLDSKRAHLERRFLLHVATDQIDFMRGVERFRVKDLRWALPLSGAAALTLGTDPQASRSLAGKNQTFWKTQSTISDIGLVTSGALAGGVYLWGLNSHDPRKRETGVLALEAATDAIVDSEAIKQLFRRDRPEVQSGNGLFFNSSAKFPSDASFVSSHAMISWSIASVIAHEYPRPLNQIAVYSLASVASITRVTGKKHFPTDILLGAAVGWYIGHQTYRAHHNSDLGVMNAGTFKKGPLEGDSDGKRRNLGSTYVPLESWVYSAMDRLAGMGFLASNFSDIRPWTRLECARLVSEAERNLPYFDTIDDSEPALLLRELRLEFEGESAILSGGENRNASIESIYGRITAIGGRPLRDGYHFGQTIYNDYGRPYADGANYLVGGSLYGFSGPWSAYFRAEYQHAPSSAPYSLPAQSAISGLEHTPLVPGFQLYRIDRVRILDAYAAVTVRKWQFSVGKQSIWWGPNYDGSMNYSNNAEPVTMFKVSTVMPLDLPGIFKYLGPAKGEAFFGQLGGQEFILTTTNSYGPHLRKQPYIEGLKVAFKPTVNLEFGASISNVWGGDGVPITFSSFRRSLSVGNTTPGNPFDPGDRRTGFDFKYRIPGLRRWLTLYNDSMAEDEINPIGYPRRSSHAPGVYLSHVPGISKLDLRGEGYFTDLPDLQGIGVWYFNNHYLSGFTNNGFLLGHPVGRQGAGYTVKSTYWFTPRNTLTLGYRHIRVNPDFLEGGMIRDYSARGKWKFGSQISLDAAMQYEHWRFPILAPTQQTNMSGSIGIIWEPKRRWWRAR